MRLAREFRRADWRRMLSEMSATELGEWGDYFRMQSFSDVWMDAQFASLKALIVRMVSGSSDAAVADFSLLLGFDLSSLSLNANGGIYQSADLSRYSGTVVNRPTFFAFAKGAGVMGEAGPEAILPLRRGADGKLGVVADIGGSGMAMFAPQYNIEINNDGTNGQIGPAALKVVYDLGKKAAADFMQQQARDGGRLSGAYR